MLNICEVFPIRKNLIRNIVQTPLLSSLYHPHHSVSAYSESECELKSSMWRPVPSHLMLQLVSCSSLRDWAGVFLYMRTFGPSVVGHGFLISIIIKMLTPLWLAVASTKKIFSTRSSCSLKAISNKSTFTVDIVSMNWTDVKNLEINDTLELLESPHIQRAWGELVA